MVGTRSHPPDFPPPQLSPSKSPSSTRSRSFSDTQVWAHRAPNLVCLWLYISLPLVWWDTFYVLLRPHTMPGGAIHAPLWSPYELYGQVDYVYGWPAWEANNGFTASQAMLNLVESVMYSVYLWMVYKHGTQEDAKGKGAQKTG